MARHRITEDPRDGFVRIEKERKAENDAYTYDLVKLQTEFEGNLRAHCRQRGIAWPKRAPVLTVKQSHKQLHDNLLAPYETLAEERLGIHQKRREYFDGELRAFANAAELEVDSTAKRLYYEAHDSDYHTQGFGASTYAEGSCKVRVWTLGYVDPDIHAVVENIGEGRWVTLCDLVSDLDIRIAQTRAYYRGVPMREYIRRCWLHGLNPRVFDPFLPHGFEEEHGLDMFGADLRTEGYVCFRCKNDPPKGAIKECPSCGFDLEPAEVATLRP